MKKNKEKKKKYSKVAEDGDIVFEKNTNLSKKSKYQIPPEFFNLGLFIAFPIVAGLFLGLFFDKRFDSGHFFTILFLFIGIISSFYNLISLNRK